MPKRILKCSSLAEVADGMLSAATDATIDQAQRMLGKAMVASVTAKDGAIPEKFTVTVNVFQNYAFPVQIEVDLQPIPEDAEFRVTPMPGELERAIRNTLFAIKEVFAQAPCPSYVV